MSENSLPDPGVLGHEIGHVVARHSAQRIAKQQLTEGLTGAVSVPREGSMGVTKTVVKVETRDVGKEGREGDRRRS